MRHLIRLVLLTVWVLAVSFTVGHHDAIGAPRSSWCYSTDTCQPTTTAATTTTATTIATTTTEATTTTSSSTTIATTTTAEDTTTTAKPTTTTAADCGLCAGQGGSTTTASTTTSSSSSSTTSTPAPTTTASRGAFPIDEGFVDQPSRAVVVTDEQLPATGANDVLWYVAVAGALVVLGGLLAVGMRRW